MGHFSKAEYMELIRQYSAGPDEALRHQAVSVRKKHYGNAVYIRGLIEFSSFCKNNCLYCGIRAGNTNARRYRLTKEEILSCCSRGKQIGFRTFVLQSGEDPYFTDDILCDLIKEIKATDPTCAITLSIGERPKESYRRFFEAGAERYLLRHETANPGHYRKLHPSDMSLESRKQCLYDLKEVGFQVGAGFMVGSPFQTTENLAEDLLFLQDLQPDMVGLGPFIAHKDTPFSQKASGSLEQTLLMLCLVRLTIPKVLLPATTALGTISPIGREEGLRCGANVVMPNLSPLDVRTAYSLYDNKICMGDEAAECVQCLKRRVESVGFTLDFSRGDSKMKKI